MQRNVVEGRTSIVFHYFIGNKQLKNRPLRVFPFENTVECPLAHLNLWIQFGIL